MDAISLREIHHRAIRTMLGLQGSGRRIFPVGCPMSASIRFHSIVAPDGVTLNVAESGPQDAPPVLLLHGIGQSGLSFRKQLEGPLAQQLRLVAPDLRGHGDSGKPADPPAYREAKRWADDVRAVQDALGLVRPVLVAWSFGGLVAMHYLRCLGSSGISGLVLVATAGGRLVAAPPAASPSEGVRLAGLAARDMASQDLRANIKGAKAFAALMYATPPDEAWEEETVAALLRLPAYVRRALAGDMIGPDGGKIASNEDLAVKVTLPLMVMVGRRDSLSDGAALAGAYRARFPGAAVLEYNTGHSPFAEDPARFDADLLSFVSAARGGTPARG